MVKASLLLMLVLTVLVAMGLRWREERMQQAVRTAPKARPGLMARGKRKLDRWVTAAAIAVIATLLIMGGLHWLRVWQG